MYLLFRKGPKRQKKTNNQNREEIINIISNFWMSSIFYLKKNAINIPKPRVCLTTFRLLIKDEKLSTLKAAKGERMRIQKTKKFSFSSFYLWLRKRFDSTAKKYRAIKW